MFHFFSKISDGFKKKKQFKTINAIKLRPFKSDETELKVNNADKANIDKVSTVYQQESDITSFLPLKKLKKRTFYQNICIFSFKTSFDKKTITIFAL